MPAVDVDKLRVLIVEEGSRVREIVRSLLQALGVETILEAGDDAEALGILHGTAVDLMVVHCQAVAQGRLGLVRQIRATSDSPAKLVPIILINRGCGGACCERAAREIGVNAVLFEPISARALAAAINAAVGESRPFVRTAGYFGPDRRQEQTPFEGPDRRSIQDNVKRNGDERPSLLSTAEG